MGAPRRVGAEHSPRALSRSGRRLGLLQLVSGQAGIHRRLVRTGPAFFGEERGVGPQRHGVLDEHLAQRLRYVGIEAQMVRPVQDIARHRADDRMPARPAVVWHSCSSSVTSAFALLSAGSA